MTASIPGENDTKRHRIALAALPFFLSACHLMPASKSGGVPSERAPVVWTVGHRASSSCMRAEQHTGKSSKLLRTNRDQSCSAAALVHSADSRNFRFSIFSTAESKPARREESID